MSAYTDNAKKVKFLNEQIEWANKILQHECVIYPNGNISHNVAQEIKEDAELELLNYSGIFVS